MSDKGETPITDRAEHRVNYVGSEGECDYMAVTSDVARRLERDRARLIGALKGTIVAFAEIDPLPQDYAAVSDAANLLRELEQS